MNFTARDKKYMRMAIKEAQKGLGYTNPNPAVGAVIVKGDEVVGRGYHKKAGTPHAEVNAIRDAGTRAEGAEIFVTLEPCNHTGKTPPCTRAILEAGLKRVVVGAIDLNPRVQGGGVEFLRGKGITVDTGCLEHECRLLIAPFVKHVKTGLPWVMAKAACSLDGRVATRTGHSKWITNERARNFGQGLRQASDAILVGKNTALEDDPNLTFRKKGRPAKRLLRVILDSRLSLPLDLKVFHVTQNAPTLVVAQRGASQHKRKELEKRGVQVLEVDPGPTGGVDLEMLLKELGAQGVQAILVEGGATVHGAFWDAGLVDEAFFFYAPIVIGGENAPQAVQGKGVAKVGDAPRLMQTKIRRFGDNFLLQGLVTDLSRFWR